MSQTALTIPSSPHMWLVVLDHTIKNIKHYQISNFAETSGLEIGWKGVPSMWQCYCVQKLNREDLRIRECEKNIEAYFSK